MMRAKTYALWRMHKLAAAALSPIWQAAVPAHFEIKMGTLHDGRFTYPNMDRHDGLVDLSTWKMSIQRSQ